MGHGHGHGLPASASGRHLRPLTVTLAIGVVFFVVELTVGLLTSSLALISDAAHLLTDVLGTAMALGAIVLARRSRQRADQTFGRYRAEVVAALANAVLLFGVAGYVIYEAIGRLADPPTVPGVPVMIAAGAGLLANVVAFTVLRAGAKESLNVRGAYLEVLSDLVGSLGVLLSGLATVLFGWRYADPIVGVAIGLFVLPRTWVLARTALRILFQHAPERVDIGAMERDLRAVAGVCEVHDLHVWTLTSGMEVASAHLATRPGVEQSAVLLAAQELLSVSYQIEHATVQIEPIERIGRCHDISW